MLSANDAAKITTQILDGQCINKVNTVIQYCIRRGKYTAPLDRSLKAHPYVITHFKQMGYTVQEIDGKTVIGWD